METLLAQYRARDRLASSAKTALKKVKYCPLTYWRF